MLWSWLSKQVFAQVQCSFSGEIPLNVENTVFLQQYVNRQEGTYSMRLRYTGGYSWIGIGVNYYDEAYMVPAYTVIGRQDEAGSLSVARYWLERTFATGILPIEDPNGHLKAGASMIQENNETILEFTHDLVILEEGVVYGNITNDSTWIWAVGPEDNDWGMRHTLQGSFTLKLSETCVDPTAPAPTNATAPATAPGNDAAFPWGDSDNLEANTTTEAASNTNIVFNEPQSRASRGLWIAHGLFMGFAWGILAPLAIGASFFRNLGFLETNALWFKLHMYLNLTVAFLTFVGFFLAVRATNKEGGQSHFKGDAHHKIGLTIRLFVMAQCLLGYFRPAKTSLNKTTESKEVKPGGISKGVANNDDDSKEDSTTVHAEPEASEKTAPNGSDDEQGFELDMANITALTENIDGKETPNDLDASKEDDSWSLFTPPPPPDSSSQDDANGEDEGQEIQPTAVVEGNEVVLSSSSVASSDSDGESGPQNSRLRTYWTYAHRIMGIILLALGWFNCNTGIELFAAKYSADNEQQLLNVFWGFTGTIAVVFLFQGYVLRP